MIDLYNGDCIEILKKLDNESVDLIILPEMFTSGFTMHPNLVAETMNGVTVLWLKNIAKANNCAITGSLVITETSLPKFLSLDVPNSNSTTIAKISTCQIDNPAMKMLQKYSSTIEHYLNSLAWQKCDIYIAVLRQLENTREKNGKLKKMPNV